MIDEFAIRTALEAVLGENLSGLPVSRIGEGCEPHGPFIRTHLVRERRTELYRGVRRAKGMFEILVHVPVKDGIQTAETIAALIPPLYRTSETENATLTMTGGQVITIREVSQMSTYRGADEQSGNERWLVCPVQIDWRMDITA